MTIEHESGTVLDVSEIRSRYLRIVRIVCHDTEGKATCRTAAFIEERGVGEEPPRITKSYLLDKIGIGYIGASTVITHAEDAELNISAQKVFSGLQGRNLDDARVLKLIEAIVDSSGKLALTKSAPL
jgi:hypothetical protein